MQWLRLARTVVQGCHNDELVTNSFDRRSYARGDKRKVVFGRLDKVAKMSKLKVDFKTVSRKVLALKFGLSLKQLLGKNGFSYLEMDSTHSSGRWITKRGTIFGVGGWP